jgi:hypothetical protein
MSRKRKPPPLKKIVMQLQEHAEQQRRVQEQAQALTDDGYPPGHPLRTLCLLMSGDQGRARYVFEQTQALTRKARK